MRHLFFERKKTNEQYLSELLSKREKSAEKSAKYLHGVYSIKIRNCDEFFEHFDRVSNFLSKKKNKFRSTKKETTV